MKTYLLDAWEITVAVWWPLLCVLGIILICVPIWLIGLPMEATGKWIIRRGSEIKYWLEDQAGRERQHGRTAKL
jgi:hypothetical protein